MSLRSPLNARRLLYGCLIREDGERLLGRDEVWDCTACCTCADRCPRGLKPVEVLRAIRSLKIESGHIPQTAIDALESSLKHGNPWGRSRRKRSAWAEGVRVRSVEQGHASERLWMVECTAAYDPRCQVMAQSLARIFEVAGFDYTTLGNEEVCCGSEMLRLGESGLFEELCETNKQTFQELGIREIVATSPHCMNTYRKDYLLGLPVHHYSEVLAEFAAEGRVPYRRELGLRVAFHDPCYLGKQNRVYDAPRAAIRAIPGVELLEFDRARERSLCCEGGGGRMWLEGMGDGERNAQIRIREAVTLGVDAVITACPFCLLTLDDARKTTGLEEKIEVVDLAELTVRSLAGTEA
ncbi:MAG: (Fe-S)-binding protein [Deltaproteobacteria bacterium]|nr:(Fe-S)-binding protein [Deltaproteobacteria bacterium]